MLKVQKRYRDISRPSAIGIVVSHLLLVACLLSSSALADRSMTTGSTQEPSNTSVLDEPADIDIMISLIDNGLYEEAINALVLATESDPTNADNFNQLGYAHSQLQNHDLALKYYDRALEIDPEHAGALAYMGKVYLELGEIELAESLLRQLDLICLFGCEPFTSLQEAIAIHYANKGG